MNKIWEYIGKVRQMPAAAKASIAFLFVSILQKGLAFLTSPIYTRILTPDEFGQVSVLISWIQLIGIIAMFCLSYGVFNNGMIDYKQDRDSFMFSMLVLSNIITFITALLFLGGYSWLKQLTEMELPLVILMFSIFFTQPAINFWTARQRYEYKYKLSSIVTIIASILSPVVAVICILTTKGSRVYARLFGAECTLIIFNLIFYVYIAYKARFKVNTSYWKYALVFNLPLIPHYLSGYVLGSSDKLMISAIINDTATGLFNVAYSVAAVVMIIWAAVNASLIPYTYEKCEQKDYKAISKVTLPILTVYAAACMLVSLLAPEAISLMATPAYAQAIYVVPSLAAGVFFQALYFIFANVVYYHKQPKYVMFASVSTAALHIALNFLLIKRFGFVAAGYTTLISYMLQAVIDYFAMKKVVGQSIYNMKYILMLSGIVLTVSLLSGFVYRLPVVRYGILALILIFAFIYRKKIFAAIKNIRKKETA